MISKHKYMVIMVLLVLVILIFIIKAISSTEEVSSPQPSAVLDVSTLKPSAALDFNTLQPGTTVEGKTPQPSAVEESTPMPQPSAAEAVASPELFAATAHTVEASPTLFTVTECAPNITFAPIHTESTFVKTPLVHGKELDGVIAISTGKMIDEAGYGYKFGSSYALRKDGTLFAWGLRNWEHREGNYAFPTAVTGLPQIISTEGEFALSTGGQVWYLNQGKTPYTIEGLDNAKEIRADGRDSLLILKSDQSLWIWRKIDGKPQGILTLLPIKQAKAIYAGFNMFFLIQTDGSVWSADSSWGWDQTIESLEFKQEEVPGLERAVQLDTGSDYNEMFMRTEGGNWYEYDVYNGLPDTHFRKADFLKDMVQVVRNNNSIVAIMNDGTVWSWAYSESINNRDATLTLNDAKKVSGITAAVNIQAGSDHVLVLTKSGKVLSWGSNMYGQLGREQYYFDKLTTVGNMSHIDGISGALAVFHQDEVWSLNGNQEIVPVMKGKSIIKMTSWNDVFLTTAGEAILKGEEGQCHMLRASTPIKDIENMDGQLLIVLQTNDSFVIRLVENAVKQIHKLRFEPAPKGEISQLMVNILPFVFTNKGEMYVQDHEKPEEWVMKPIADAPFIQEASPIYGSFYYSYGNIAKVRDQDGNVYNIELTLERNDKSEITSQLFKVNKTGEKAKHLLGEMIVTDEGKLLEHDYFQVQDQLGAGDQIRFMDSSYHYSNGGEGQSTFSHVFIMEDNRIRWLGYSPSKQEFTEPAPVVFEK